MTELVGINCVESKKKKNIACYMTLWKPYFVGFLCLSFLFLIFLLIAFTLGHNS